MDSSEVIEEKSMDLIKCPELKKVEFDDEAHLKKYIMWENKSNICWLDSSMALIAHNRTMKKYSRVSPQCCINKIISAYDDAIRILNGSEKTMEQKLNLARGRLNYIQESTLDYLQPILKYRTGDYESAHCSLYNLLIQDSVVKKIFDVTWLSVKECTDCGYNSESTKSKPIVTLSKIHSFDPENLKVIYRCNCNKEQTMKLVFVSLPPCLIFHFENGAGNEKPPLSFITQKRIYYLTGIMTLEKSQDSTVNHFITWVRDPSVDKWLDCNDLNLDVVCFSPDFPDINIKDVSMYVYEAFDDLGTITDSKLVKGKKSEENIPIIYLSDNSDDEVIEEMSDSKISATESSKDTGENKPLKPDLKSSSAKLDTNTSLRRTLTTDKNAVEKSVQQADCTEHLKNISHNMVNENINVGQTKPVEVDKDKIPDENIKTDKNKVLKTSISAGSNLISIASNCAKEISKDICKSDSSVNKNDIAEKINENTCLFPNSRDDSLTSDDRHNDFVTKDSISAENEPSFNDEKNSKNASRNIQNNELLSKVASPNISKTVIPLKGLKIKDLIQLKFSDKTNVKKDDINNLQQFQTSNAEQRENKFILSSKGQQEKLSSHFLTNVGASSSGTSYVKLVRRKKILSDTLNKANFANDSVNPDLSDALDNTYVATPSTSTSLKRKRVAEDDDYVPLSEKSKKKKLSNGGKDSVSSEKKIQEDLQSAQKKSQVKSKLNNTSTRTVGSNSASDDSPRSHTGPGCRADATENSANYVTILRDFANSLSCHESGCNCESAESEEILESGVEFTFAYYCKLNQEFQKFC